MSKVQLSQEDALAFIKMALKQDNHQLVYDMVKDIMESAQDAYSKLVDQRDAIRDAVQEHNDALTNRKHGGVAQNKAFDEICTILNMHWKG